MNELRRTDEFNTWLQALSDQLGKARILARLRSAVVGNFGDIQPVGDGVSEMRIHVGPGYRVYYVRRGRTVYLLLCGGDKSSQQKDIRRAKELASEIKD